MSEYDCNTDKDKDKDTSFQTTCNLSFSKYSTLDHSSMGFEPLFVFDIFTILGSQVKLRLNLAFSLLKPFSTSRSPSTTEEKQVRKLSLSFKRNALQKCIKKMLWTSHVNLTQRPFWIWKILIGEQSNKIQFTQRSKQLVLRAFVNRLNRKLSFWLENIFYCIKTTDFQGAAKNTKKIMKRKQRLVRKQSFIVFKKEIKVYFKILNTVFSRRLEEYIKEWKNCQWWYETSLQEVNCSKLNVKNYKVLSKPKIELVFYEKNLSNPALKAFFHSLCHMRKERLKFGTEKLSLLTKNSVPLADPISAYKNLIYGDRKYRFYKVVLRSIASSKEKDDKKKRIFNIKRSPFLYVCKLNKLELIFRRGQYFTGLKKLIYNV